MCASWRTTPETKAGSLQKSAGKADNKSVQHEAPPLPNAISDAQLEHAS